MAQAGVWCIEPRKDTVIKMMRKWLPVLLLLCIPVGPAMAGDTTYNFYGHVMLDAGYDTKQVDPSWYDVMRPPSSPLTRINSARTDMFFAFARRVSVCAHRRRRIRDMKTQFEFELFGTASTPVRRPSVCVNAYGESASLRRQT